jgi:RNA polymerase sigma factor (sigma-70 family)
MSSLYADCNTMGREKPNDLTKEERNALVEGCLPWCKKLAREHAQTLKCAERHFDADDLEAEAYVACCSAAQYYRPERGTKFITMASAWIRTHLRSVTDARRIVVPGRMEQPELVEDRDEADDDSGAYTPNTDEERMLKALAEPARSVVRLVVFEGLRPDQVAAQLNMDVKDVKLIMRNSVAKLGDYLQGESEPNLWTVGA